MFRANNCIQYVERFGYGGLISWVQIVKGCSTAPAGIHNTPFTHHLYGDTM
jgi:hypothetical protein